MTVTPTFGKLLRLMGSHLYYPTVFVRSLPVLVAVVSFSGCAGLQAQDYATSRAPLDPIRFFTGHSRSWGVFENQQGHPTRYFTCNSFGQRNAEGGLALAQHFIFNDGKTQTRNWQIRRLDTNHWEATANDIIGVARGTGFGNAVSFEYTITLDGKNPLATIHVRQWIYQPEGTESLMTRLVISKLGFTVAEVSEVIHHLSGEVSN
jgi:Protein of unknown function (DUF3833)